MTKPTKSSIAKAGNARAGVPKTGPTTPGATKPGSTKASATKRDATKAGVDKRQQSRKIVNQRQTPWGLIISIVVVVVIAIGVIGYAVSKNNSKKSAGGNPNTIVGIQHYTNLSRNHTTSIVSYPQSPPVGGDHSPVWADCTGTIYPNQIANENAVHTLEHGAVWITYKPGLPATQLDALTKLVSGNQYTLLTPYAGLKTNLSLQAWGYQLFVDSATDPRVKQFIDDLKLSQSNTPEFGASCDNPTFKTNPSTPGHPSES